MSVHLEDKKLRNAAFDWLDEQVRHYGDVLPQSLLTQGFELEGQRVPLVSRQGIFKPKVLREIPISITTSPSGGPYDDKIKRRFRSDPNSKRPQFLVKVYTIFKWRKNT